jgi:diacylglycerol kinase (ATP)
MLPKIRELKIHALIFLNIPCYANGKNPWKNNLKSNEFTTQSYSDEKLEVIGFSTADLVFFLSHL